MEEYILKFLSIFIYLFHHEQAGQSHCFNAQCGYVHISREMPLDMVLGPVSSYGGKQYGMTLSIVKVCANFLFFYLLQLVIKLSISFPFPSLM